MYLPCMKKNILKAFIYEKEEFSQFNALKFYTEF
ncbi:hypothetical protein SAMN06265171_101347 [Chryseobacterium rhizoplanae]|uniref:Uncharacterized protein n=1 Tax=Chryseobacterium rhizoplanae TaxID=1609531 RepID=A0A521AQ01_9FLAO|nr:hypothetical protein SAMN06265171_101347 [Chryseobacterium rhizoplanae]